MNPTNNNHKPSSWHRNRILELVSVGTFIAVLMGGLGILGTILSIETSRVIAIQHIASTMHLSLWAVWGLFAICVGLYASVIWEVRKILRKSP
ncbi:MAG TPA: hypothetical protein VJH33_01175 [Candidatus Paceibacterota bacterium]